MKEIKDGLFAVEEQMPCGPRDIAFRKYILPSTLGNSEPEEAAARILSFSQELDQWVGVSWRRIVEVMEEEHAKFKAAGSSPIEGYRPPASGIFAFGPRHVEDGIRDLMVNNWVRRVVLGQGVTAKDVFFPTAKLILRIMEKQGVVSA